MTFKVISTFVIDIIIPQGIQKIKARNTVRWRERQNYNRRRMILASVQDNGRIGVGWESTNTEGAQGDRSDEDTKVNTLRNFTVFPHEASVDVLAIGKDGLAGDQVLETRNDLATVVEDGVSDCSSVNGKEYTVNEGVPGREVSGRIGLVTRLVEHGVLVHDLQDLITASGVVPHVVVVDRNVSGVPCVCVPNREDYGGREEGAEETVEGAVEWADKRITCDSELVPVPGGEGVETKTADTTGYRSQLDIIGGDPGHPVEIGHGLNDVVGEPKVDEHGNKAVHEPSHPRDSPPVSDLVGLGMEGTLGDNEVRGDARAQVELVTYIQCDNGQV
jgi:hypothetical protein